jgi:hypothetical protein
MLTIDQLLDARADGFPVMIIASRARRILKEHSLGVSDFQEFIDGHAYSAGGMICAASLYEWLGY